jgi:tetratricopeptide (TPR) repeat protein
MTENISKLLLILLILSFKTAFSQPKDEKVRANLKEAIGLMNNGKFDESIKVLQKAQKEDPTVFDYPYEIGYAYYEKGNYKEAIKTLSKLTNHKDVVDLLFQLLGNSYDMSGDRKKAFEVYQQGLKKFPKSGALYLEQGNIYFTEKKYEDAMAFYEKGIEIDPTFPSNYYRATLIYCNSSEEVWGMIYGEIFMNLERGGKRTAEISKLLYDTYKQGIEIKNGTEIAVSFSQNIVISDLKNPKIPFTMVYETLLGTAVVPYKTIDINSLSGIRSDFLSNYFLQENNLKYPNVLFDFQKKIADAGHFETYTHWLLMKGDEEAFEKWATKNEQKMNDFVAWFKVNGLELSDKQKFYRSQY